MEPGLRLAATVLIIRDQPFEVMMVKRNTRPPFASALVFPGGVLEPDDYAQVWRSHVVNAEVYDERELALRIAACRETWEEAGILICGDDKLLPVRGVAGEPFFNTVKRHGQQLELDRLVPFAHWITPEAVAKRFDTHFYLCRAPAAQDGQCDGRETVELEWLQPSEGLARAARGDSSILLPTRKNLELLAETPTTERALDAARQRKVIPILPRPIANGAETVMSISYPGSPYRE